MSSETDWIRLSSSNLLEPPRLVLAILLILQRDGRAIIRVSTVGEDHVDSRLHKDPGSSELVL